MTNEPNNFESLLSELLDHANEDAADAIERLMLERPEYIDRYLDHVTLHAQLHRHHGGPRLEAPVVIDDGPLVDKPPRVLRRFFLLAAVVALGMGLSWLFFANASPLPWGPRSYATLVKHDSAQWRIGSTVDASTLAGTSLGRSVLDVESGAAELLFANGAMVSFDGPGQLELTGPNSAELRRGTVLASVPPRARGFTITAPGLRLVDLGTEFIISVDERRHTDARVLKGSVELRPASGPTQALLAGQTVRFAGDVLQQLPSSQRPRFSDSVYFEDIALASLRDRAGSSDTRAALHPERAGVLLDEALTVWKSQPTPGLYRGLAEGQSLQELPPGTRVDSYLLQFKPHPDGQDDVVELKGTITFDRPIVALIATRVNLAQTNDLLGFSFMINKHSFTSLEPLDEIRIWDDGSHTLGFHFRTLRGSVEHLRVLVASP